MIDSEVVATIPMEKGLLMLLSIICEGSFLCLHESIYGCNSHSSVISLQQYILS
jgi:hypothetical protein